jgi:hypothetical protein
MLSTTNVGGIGGAAIRFEERIVVVHGEGSEEEERHTLIGMIKWCYLSGTMKQDGMEVCSAGI